MRGREEQTGSFSIHVYSLCLFTCTRRSLGVHLSFVRSTQLDSWTWTQLRAMQVGGNAPATAYFRQHGCNAKEAHAKYQSRAAQLYREKLGNMAITAQRSYGTQVHVEAHQPGESKDEDFFTSAITQAQQQMGDFTLDMSVSATATKPQNSSGRKNGSVGEDLRQPNVSCLHSPSSPSAPAGIPKELVEVKPSLIGKRKTPAKSGLGARKGLGGQKVTKSFSEIEAEAEQQKQAEQQFMPSPTTPGSKDDFPHDLGYREPKNLDPLKAKQAERLGMGVGRVSSQSHSASAGMDTIDQTGPIRTSQNRMDRIGGNSRGFDSFRVDDYGPKGRGGYGSVSRYDPPGYSSGGYASQERDRDLSYSQKTSKHSAFTNQPSTLSSKPSSQVSSFGSMQRGGEEGRGGGSTSTWGGGSGSTWGSATAKSSGGRGGGEDAQQRFSSAKSISSDQYFGRASSGGAGGGGTWDGGDANLSRFSGSSSISSDQYFGRNEKARVSEGPDMTGLKEGVSNLGSKVSAAAGRMMESIQDRYHGYTS